MPIEGEVDLRDTLFLDEFGNDIEGLLGLVAYTILALFRGRRLAWKRTTIEKETRAINSQ